MAFEGLADRLQEYDSKNSRQRESYLKLMLKK